jgi:hypothetical protein
MDIYMDSLHLACAERAWLWHEVPQFRSLSVNR